MIKVDRLKSTIDQNTTYNILIDNNDNETIDNGETKILKLRSNNYKIQLKGKGIKSNVVSFTVDNKKDLTFVCYPSYKNNFLSKFIHKKILKKGIILKLEK